MIDMNNSGGVVVGGLDAGNTRNNTSCNTSFGASTVVDNNNCSQYYTGDTSVTTNRGASGHIANDHSIHHHLQSRANALSGAQDYSHSGLTGSTIDANNATSVPNSNFSVNHLLELEELPKPYCNMLSTSLNGLSSALGGHNTGPVTGSNGLHDNNNTSSSKLHGLSDCSDRVSPPQYGSPVHERTTGACASN